jgi:hypothetical protein
MKKNSKAMEFTLREAGEYFDDHDIFDFGDVIEIKDFSFNIPKKKYVGLDEGLFEKIRDKAKKLRIKEETLIQSWLEEKVGRNY